MIVKNDQYHRLVIFHNLIYYFNEFRYYLFNSSHKAIGFLYLCSVSTLFKTSASGTMAFIASCTVFVCAPTSTSSVFGQ